MMEYGSDDVSRDETRQAVNQAILLNEYLLRRAWGVLYLALSLSMLLSIFAVPIIDSVESIGIASAISVDMAASGCGVIAILWAFNRVRNTVEITHPKGDKPWSRLLGYRFVIPLWIAFNAAAVLTIVLARAQVPLVVLLLHIGLAAYLFNALRLSFSKSIPGEGLVAVGSLSLSSIASIALLTIFASPALAVLLSAATIVVWISSGVYARSRPVPEIEEERTGLE